MLRPAGVGTTPEPVEVLSGPRRTTDATEDRWRSGSPTRTMTAPFPRCAHCGEPIGMYELAWWERQDEPMLEASLAATRSAEQRAVTSRGFHAECVRWRTPGASSARNP
jgi:hypothetical protein